MTTSLLKQKCQVGIATPDISVYSLETARDALRNSFINFSISKEALRARVPAALLPFSTCAVAFFTKAS